MGDTGSIVFPPYRLDLADERLLMSDRPIPLAPRAFAVLSHLARRAGRLVTKEDLLETVWQGAHVQEAVLKVAVREIRRALNDSATVPRFIETVHRRGYRFVAEVLHPAGEERHEGARAAVVGRDRELLEMRLLLERAQSGDRQVVFVSGETGIGKTAFVHAFLEEAAADRRVLVARGTCLEQYGAGEAYRPVLEALGRLARGPERHALVALLRRDAPTWLAQMPFLLGETDHEALRQEILGATSERMQREMAGAIEELTSRTALVLVLEDLQWSDYSTLDLITTLGRRREPARLLLVGTYREAEVDRAHHPLRAVKQELSMRRQCHERRLEHLDLAAVAAYLLRRFPGTPVPEPLVRAIHRRTVGNPLFMVNVADYLAARDLIGGPRATRDLDRALHEVETGVPESLRRMIETQVDRLTEEERSALEAASVAGLDFSTQAVAAGLGGTVARAEEALEDLARRGLFIQATGAGSMPDGTVTARFGFLHPLYQSVLYQGVTLARRLRLHQRIGERGIAAYGERAAEIAAELAVHFEQARDYRTAVDHLSRAAENAARRYANREAIDHLTRAFDLVGRLPEGERGGPQLAILEQVGTVRRSIGDVRGASEDFEAMVALAREQGSLDGEARGLFYLGSTLFWFDRDRFEAAAARALDLVPRFAGDDRLRAHTRGYAAYWRLLVRGWRAEDSGAQAEAIAIARRTGDRRLLEQHLVRHAYVLMLQSRYADGCAAAREAARLALEAGDGFDYLLSQFFLAGGLLHAGEWGEMAAVLEKGLRMAETNGHERWVSLFRLEKARLHQAVFDHETAMTLAEEALDVTLETGHAHTNLLGRVLLGTSLLAGGEVQRAALCFDAAGDIERRERTLMDWSRHMPVGLGAGEFRIARGELASARLEAERVRDLAAGPGERTYQALAGEMLARISLLEGNRASAERALAEALVVVGATDAPVAAWRVHATAAAMAERETAATEHLARSAAVLERLADSLRTAPPLRESFLAAGPVRTILARPSAPSLTH